MCSVQLSLVGFCGDSGERKKCKRKERGREKEKEKERNGDM
jgi:hypothetical protein